MAEASISSPVDMSVREALRPEAAGRHITIKGWVRTSRPSKAGVTFVEVNDGSSLANLQVVVPHELPNYTSDVETATTGASVIVSGPVVDSPAAGQATELRA